MTDELYKRYRPTKLKNLYGQEALVSSLTQMFKNDKVPHTILLSGPSGCGKTTVARIIRDKLKCADNDFHEMNCADLRGVDTIRDIRSRMSLQPLGGSCIVWLIDEAHQLTSDAQNAALKILEDTPKHVYFILATTDPHKLKPTVRTRCTHLEVEPLAPAKMRELVESVCKKEESEISEKVIDKIVEASEGSARKALVLLDAVFNQSTEEGQLKAITVLNWDPEVIELCRLLMNQRTTWKDVNKIIPVFKPDPEKARRAIIGYAASVLINSGNPRAFNIIQCLGDNLFDSGYAGLVAGCFDVLQPAG